MKTCECLYDMIGLSAACEDQQRCANYVDQLPGIQRDDFEFLTTRSNALASEVWEKVQARAVGRIAQDIQNAMSDRFEVRPIVEDIQTGTWHLPHDSESLENKWKGVMIDIRHSRNLSVYISSVELYTPAPIVDSVRVYDLYTGILLDTIPFDVAAAGFFTVEINAAYQGEAIGVFYDGAVLASLETDRHTEEYFDDICEPCNCTCTRAFCAQIDKADPVLRTSVNYICSGMIVNYSLHCSLEHWICRNKEKVKTALWYLMGVEFFTEVLASRRLNELTLIDSERLQQMTGYSIAQYKQAIQAFTEGAQIDDRICVNCKSRYKRKLLIN